MTFITIKDPIKRVAKHPTKRAVTTIKAKTTTLQQQQKHQTTQNLTTNQKITKATTTINVQNSNKFGALIPAKQTTKRSNRIGHGKRCMRFGCGRGSSKRRVLKDLPQKQGNQQNLELEEAPKSDAHQTSTAVEDLGAHWKGKYVPTKERVRWKLEPSKVSRKSPPYKTRSEE